MISGATAVVRDPNNVPHVDSLVAPNVSEVVTEIWSGAWVLSAIPDGIWECH